MNYKACTYRESLPEPLKEQIANAILENFLREDVADSLMGVATEQTEPFINRDNQDLFSEISGMVGYKIAQLIEKGASSSPSQTDKVPTPEELLNRLLSEGWQQIGLPFKGLNIVENPDYPGRQMVFPVSASAPDYEESARSVIAKVAYLRKSNNQGG